VLFEEHEHYCYAARCLEFSGRAAAARSLGSLLAGETAKAIAARLGVSIRTVKNRVGEIYDVAAVSSRAELLDRRAQQIGRAR
jgi:DNA-binding CsgD family transcriptional regulator